MKITKIEPRNSPSRPLRVAAYCRISTLLDGQPGSLESQRIHYQNMIASHIGWELEDLYLENGVTGTKAAVRPELNRLLLNCRSGGIDLILTKSISRFARNVTDCLLMVRELRALGIRVIFEKERLDTGLMDGEFLLTILSSLAEEESHAISENEKWAIHKRMMAGTYRQSRAPYGFRRAVLPQNPEAPLVPDLQESAIVIRIFDYVLEGKGAPWIAGRLNAEGIPSPDRKNWCPFTVRAIVKNPAVIGDMLMNKSYRDRRFHRHLNLGEKPLYYQDHHHEPLIAPETFELANASMRQRGLEKGNDPGPPGERALHRSPHARRYPFSGKLICAECGSTLRRVIQYTSRGTRIRWECQKHRQNPDACSSGRVLEDNIKNAFLTCLNKLRYASFILDTYCAELKPARIPCPVREISDATGWIPDSPANAPAPIGNTHGPAASATASGNIEYYHAALSLRAFIKKHNSGDPFPDESFTRHVRQAVIGAPNRFTFIFYCGLSLTEAIEPS